MPPDPWSKMWSAPSVHAAAVAATAAPPTAGSPGSSWSPGSSCKMAADGRTLVAVKTRVVGVAAAVAAETAAPGRRRRRPPVEEAPRCPSFN